MYDWSWRTYLAIVGLVGVGTGVVLLWAPGETAAYFAWPINPPTTAVFMGAGYLGTGLTLLGALGLAQRWREAQLILFPVLTFAVVMLLATFLHADRFLWDRPVTWLWTVLYGVIVLGSLMLRRIAGWVTATNPREALTPGERGALLGVGVLTSAWAVAFFAAPALAAPLWPWPLTPLTARVVAGWIAVGALLALLAAWWGDVVNIRLPVAGWVLTVVLIMTATAWQAGGFVGGPLQGLIYLGGLGASVLGAVTLLLRTQRRRHGN